MREVVEATDLESAREVLAGAYGPLRIVGRGERQGMRLSRASLGPVKFDHARFGMEFDAQVPPPGVLYFGELKAGRVAYDSDGEERARGAGDVFLIARPDQPYTAKIRASEMALATLDPALIGQVAEAGPGLAGRPVRFAGNQPVSPTAAALWKRTYAFVYQELLATPEIAEHPLVAAAAVRLLVATALATFPNDAVTEPTVTDRHDASTATLRRAIAFIDEHAHEDISATDVAAAACVTLRAVQLAFRRHLDTTPMGYLRRVRLERAHRDLLAGEPGRESVTQVAYRWGFGSPSRFSARYSEVYGVPPSHTLHRK